jgi:hypothetical protein
MTQFVSSAAPIHGASVIPVLSTLIPVDQISQEMAAALQLREEERNAFMAMAEEVAQSLRPELERLTTELVQRSLQQAWRSKFQNADR